MTDFVSDVRVKMRRLVTMRELNQQTSEVMNELLDSGDPTIVTRYGRPVAVITPISPSAEATLLSRLVDSTRGLPRCRYLLDSFW